MRRTDVKRRRRIPRYLVNKGVLLLPYAVIRYGRRGMFVLEISAFLVERAPNWKGA
jgi:hypothetical protein